MNKIDVSDLNDFRRWVRNFEILMDEYSDEKYLYEKEKMLNIEDEELRSELKLSVSDNKGALVDLRKGFDWFVNEYKKEPTCYHAMVKRLSIKQNRLKKLKKYLSYRVRSLAGKGEFNEISKDILMYIRIKLDAINILFDPKHNERTPLEIIYGLENIEDNDSLYDEDGVTRNNLFYRYD